METESRNVVTGVRIAKVGRNEVVVVYSCRACPVGQLAVVGERQLLAPCNGRRWEEAVSVTAGSESLLWVLQLQMSRKDGIGSQLN